MLTVPKCFFLTHGTGVHRERLTAFELALRDADIEQQNLVSISSILPPHCAELDRLSGVATLQPGDFDTIREARHKSLYSISDETLAEYLGYTHIMIGMLNRLDLFKAYRKH